MRFHDHFDRWAPRYDRSLLQGLFFQPVHASALDAAGAAGAAPREVLDVGCGTGRLLEAAAARWNGAHLTGVDVSGPMIAEARRKHEGDARFAFETGDAAALPLETASIDAAFTTMSFHHWHDQAAGLREVARVLRPGGLFVLADVDVPLLPLLRPVLDRLDGAHFVGPEDLARLAGAAGLSVVARRWRWRVSRSQIFVARKPADGQRR